METQDYPAQSAIQSLQTHLESPIDIELTRPAPEEPEELTPPTRSLEEYFQAADRGEVPESLAEALSNSSAQDKIELAKQNGICTRCFTNKTTEPYFVCDACREKQKAGQAASRARAEMEKQNAVSIPSTIKPGNTRFRGTGTPQVRFTSPPPKDTPKSDDPRLEGPQTAIPSAQPAVLEIDGIRVEIRREGVSSSPEDVKALFLAFLNCNLPKQQVSD